MTFKKLALIFLAIVITIIPLSGCDKTADAYLYFELPALPSTLDPQVAESTSELLIVKNIYEGLMRKDKDGKVVCGVADSFEKSGKTYIFNIRDDAKWSNGDDVTADDFVFSLKRALDPNTKAPFATRLYCIKNAVSVHTGKLDSKNLGVTAKNKKTLEIELDYEDENFLENLTTSVALPCNRNFFNESSGKYGLFKDNIISNGSYRLTKWNKEVFGIRLYKNEEYTGKFEAKNAAVFLTCNNDETVTEKLKKNSIDLAFIDAAYDTEMKQSGFKTVNCQNICWVMTFGNDFSYDLRHSFIKLIGNEVYGENLPSGYSFATSLFPSIFNENVENAGVTLYDPEGAKALYKNEIAKLEDKKFPTDVTLYYYDNGFMKPIVTDIVGHWQNRLSAFINIEQVSSEDELLPQLKEQTLPIAVFPITAGSENKTEYLKHFGISYNNDSLSVIQTSLLESKHITPIAFQNTTLCCSPAIEEVYTVSGDGFVDFSLIVKNE